METYRQQASYSALCSNEETMKQINNIRHYDCDLYLADFCNKMLCKMIDDSGGNEEKKNILTSVCVRVWRACVRTCVCTRLRVCVRVCIRIFASKKR